MGSILVGYTKKISKFGRPKNKNIHLFRSLTSNWPWYESKMVLGSGSLFICLRGHNAIRIYHYIIAISILVGYTIKISKFGRPKNENIHLFRSLTINWHWYESKMVLGSSSLFICLRGHNGIRIYHYIIAISIPVGYTIKISKFGRPKNKSIHIFRFLTINWH